MDFNNWIQRIITSIFIICFLFISITFFESYLFYLILLIYFLIFLEVTIFFKKNILLIPLFIYLAVSLYCFELFILEFYDKKLFLYFLFIVVCFDTSSYIMGSYFGKKKILPSISPNKTYFGFIAGIIITLFLSILLNSIFNVYDFFKSILFIIIIIISAFIGDIIESFCKRSSKLKNSSNLLPGHGGIFDRFDSFVMSTIALLLFMLT